MEDRIQELETEGIKLRRDLAALWSEYQLLRDRMEEKDRIIKDYQNKDRHRE